MIEDRKIQKMLLFFHICCCCSRRECRPVIPTADPTSGNPKKIISRMKVRMQSTGTADDIGYRLETGHKFNTSLHTIVQLQVI